MPWGTPEFASAMLEVIPSTNPRCFLNYKKLSLICKVVPWISLYFRLRRRPRRGTLSNASSKPNKMIDIVSVR